MATKKKAAKKAVKKAAPKKKSATAKKQLKGTFKNYVTHLKAGDPAPGFQGLDQDGKRFRLMDSKEKNWYSIFIRRI